MLSLLVAVPVLSVSIPVRATHKEALLGAGAVGGVFAELFCIKSLLTFDPAQPPVGAIDAASQLKWNIAHVSAAAAACCAVCAVRVQSARQYRWTLALGRFGSQPCHRAAQACHLDVV